MNSEKQKTDSMHSKRMDQKDTDALKFYDVTHKIRDTSKYNNGNRMKHDTPRIPRR